MMVMPKTKDLPKPKTAQEFCLCWTLKHKRKWLMKSKKQTYIAKETFLKMKEYSDLKGNGLKAKNKNNQCYI